MKLLSQYDYAKLLDNGKSQNGEKDHWPVVKLFLPGTGCTWLLTDVDPRNNSIAFGLCDLGLGFPELGYADLNELWSVRSCLGLRIEKDNSFVPKHPISVYADEARKKGMIVDL